MDGFSQAYKATKGHRALVHIIPPHADRRCRAMCGYRPRSAWDVVVGMGGYSTADTCEPCRATYERVLRRTDRATA